MSLYADRSLPSSPCLVLGEGVRDEIVAWALGGLPQEACGLLVGEMDEMGAGMDAGMDAAPPVRTVRRVTLSLNLAVRAGDQFVLDPAHWVQVEREAADQHLQILGLWHSHPAHSHLAGRASYAGAAPSARDLDGAIQGWSYLIVSIDGSGAACVRSWRMPATTIPQADGWAPPEERLRG